MANIEEIRESFSKGTVVVSSDGVSVFYTYAERWFSQSVSGKSKRVFLDLLEACDSFGIECKAERFIKLIFTRKTDGKTVVFYQPLTEEVSIEEMQAIMASTEPCEDFLEYMDGADLQDDEELYERLLGWIEKVSSTRENDVPDSEKWELIYEFANKLARFCVCTCEVFENESIELQFPEGKIRRFLIKDDDKENLRNLIDLCSSIGIEGYVPDGFLNITFYA